jgi:outer membrane protein
MKYKLKMKKLIIFLMMILPLGAFAQDVKIAFVKTQEVIKNKASSVSAITRATF